MIGVEANVMVTFFSWVLVIALSAMLLSATGLVVYCVVQTIRGEL